jgi:hypothetical protein
VNRESSIVNPSQSTRPFKRPDATIGGRCENADLHDYYDRHDP